MRPAVCRATVLLLAGVPLGLALLAAALAAATPRLCAGSPGATADAAAAARAVSGGIVDLALDAAGTAGAVRSAVGAADAGRALDDALRYQAHAAVGTYLAAIGCDPTEIGVQWFKAAFHARGEAQTRRAAGGMLLALSRTGDSVAFARTVCAARGRDPRAEWLDEALERAGITCLSR